MPPRCATSYWPCRMAGSSPSNSATPTGTNPVSRGSSRITASAGSGAIGPRLADQDQAPFGFLPETADFLYVRLMGDPRTKYNADGERVFHYKERLWSRAAAMESWAVRLHKQAEHVKSIYTFVNNHYEGFAPVTCRELGARLGLDIDLPSTALPEAGLEGPRQMTLL